MAAETPISVEGLLEACGASSLDQVRSVNFWAKKLTSKQVQQTVGQCANLEVASLSINEVDSLKAFKGNTQLQELFLRKNNVADIREVGHLADLPLRVLWLSDNPCDQHELYRELVVRLCPKLVKLDKTDVTAEERAKVKEGVNPRLDALAQEALAFAAGGATPDASPAPSSPAAPSAVLRAVMTLLPLLSKPQLQSVREAAAKLSSE